MAKDPAFLFYTSDFVIATRFMSNSQVGIYIRLLCEQHINHGVIPKDIFDSILGEPDQTIISKFQKNEEGYFNVRLKDEIEKRQAYSESRRKNRSKSNKVKDKLKSKKDESHMINICNTYDEHMENENENINNNINISFKKIIEYLNSITGSNYKSSTNKTQTLIKARWNEGFRFEDFKACIDNAWKYWKDKPEGNTYMRPSTLFNGSFENRVNGSSYNFKPNDKTENTNELVGRYDKFITGRD
jgi:uncharacterized phage protein (TIGR02220 family)